MTTLELNELFVRAAEELAAPNIAAEYCFVGEKRILLPTYSIVLCERPIATGLNFRTAEHLCAGYLYAITNAKVHNPFQHAAVFAEQGA